MRFFRLESGSYVRVRYIVAVRILHYRQGIQDYWRVRVVLRGGYADDSWTHRTKEAAQKRADALVTELQAA